MTKVIPISPRIFTGSAVSIPFTVMFHGKSDKRRFLGSSASFPFTSSCSQYRENFTKLGLAPKSKTAKNNFVLFDTFTVVIMYPGNRPQSVYNMVFSSLGFLYLVLCLFGHPLQMAPLRLAPLSWFFLVVGGILLRNAPLLLKKHLGLVAVLRGLPAPLAPWAVIAIIFLL